MPILTSRHESLQENLPHPQQIAEFPYARPDETWHGYPLWPLIEAGPDNRRGEKSRPSKGVFLRMVAAQMLTPRERKRLQKGDHL